MAMGTALNNNLIWHALLILLLPLFSFFLSHSIKSTYSWVAPIIGSFILIIASILSIILFINLDTLSWELSFPWLSIGNHNITVGIILNQITVTMVMVVTIVSCLVHLYSIGYMSHDQKIQSYFALLGFFTFSMIGLVISNNLLITFCFWELVGYSSYRLIGFWSERKVAIAAATKSFLINRVADVGFIAGLMILYQHASLDISNLASISIDPYWATAAAICIFIGVMGKSAQFPFFIWLPDAMEGPTPVSALIHAATMVAAGIFLLIRIQFLLTQEAMMFIAVIGALTSVLGAIGALFQFDIKKILAYSTISQLGLMILAIGCGAFDGSYLHLLNHAFFKAGLFLVAGSLIHALHHSGTQDIRSMSGLRKKLPVTLLSFVVCASALAGLPFTSGFVSKEMMLTEIIAWAGRGVSLRWIIASSAFLVTFLTALYTFRLGWYLLSSQTNASAEVNESPKIMQWPMVLASLASIAIVMSSSPIHISGWTDTLLGNKVENPILVTVLSTVLIAMGFVFSLIFYRRRPDNPYPSYLTTNFLFLDQVYTQFVVTPILWISKLTIHIDLKWIDRSIHQFAYGVTSLAHVANWMDRIVIDKILVEGTALTAKGVGSVVRSVVSGKIQYYLLWALAGFLIFMIALLYF